MWFKSTVFSKVPVVNLMVAVKLFQMRNIKPIDSPLYTKAWQCWHSLPILPIMINVTNSLFQGYIQMWDDIVMLMLMLDYLTFALGYIFCVNCSFIDVLPVVLLYCHEDVDCVALNFHLHVYIQFTLAVERSSTVLFNWRLWTNCAFRVRRQTFLALLRRRGSFL